MLVRLYIDRTVTKFEIDEVNLTKLLKNDCAECNKPLCIFCAKNQLDLKTTLVVIVVADEQVKKITNTFKPLKKVKGEKGHE